MFIFFGGKEDFAKNAYKYNPAKKMYTKLTNATFDIINGRLAVKDNKIYIAITSNVLDSLDLYEYNPATGVYTKLGNEATYSFKEGSVCVVKNDVFVFGSSLSGDENKAVKYNLTEGTWTTLEQLPDNFYNGSAIVIDEDEIDLIGVDDVNNTVSIYKYNILENEYNKISVLLGKTWLNTVINKFAYLGINKTTSVPENILLKYNKQIKSIYQYGDKIIIGSNDIITGFAGVKKDIYYLTKTALYKADIELNYEEDGLYVILQDVNISKNIDIKNILDVKKIKNEEKQDILVYVGDGESWTLLNSDIPEQTDNSLQYILNFKGGN